MSEEWKVPVDESEDKAKMVIVMRKDLKCPKGKYCSQASHAAVGVVIQAIFSERLKPDDFVDSDIVFDDANGGVMCKDREQVGAVW